VSNDHRMKPPTPPLTCPKCGNVDLFRFRDEQTTIYFGGGMRQHKTCNKEARCEACQRIFITTADVVAQFEVSDLPEIPQGTPDCAPEVMAKILARGFDD